MFHEKLNELFDMLRKDGVPLPQHFLVGELGVQINDGRGIPIFRGRDLVLAQDYGARFDTLVNEGYPWINVSYYGTLDTWGLIVIELPASDRKNSKLVGSTLVRLSGPSKRVLDNGGDTLPYVVLEGALPDHHV